MSTELIKRKALVIGGTSGIGFQIVSDLLLDGFKVSVVGRNFTNFINENINLKKIYCDLSESVTPVIENSDQYDFLVFSAGTIEYAPLKYLNFSKFYKNFEINYFSSIKILTELLKVNKINRNGSIVFISSISANLGVPGTLIYSATKAAIESSVRVMASELAHKKIRVNAIAPGIVKTPFIENAVIDELKMVSEESKYPLGFGLPSQISNLALFLLSEKSDWITGQILTIDGGVTLASR